MSTPTPTAAQARQLSEQIEAAIGTGSVQLNDASARTLVSALRILVDPKKWMQWCDERVLERAEVAEAALTAASAAQEAELQQARAERDANVQHNRELQQQLDHRLLTYGAAVQRADAAEARLTAQEAEIARLKAARPAFMFLHVPSVDMTDEDRLRQGADLAEQLARQLRERIAALGSSADLALAPQEGQEGR